MSTKYTPTDREMAFLDGIENPKYERGNINGLANFFKDKVPDDVKGFYSEEELAELKALSGTERDVEARMPVKMTRHYFELAKNSAAIQQIVKARPEETNDLAGSEDPGHQMDYAPVEGMLHKYELGLLYVASTCSAHCRFCYREELIARKEVAPPRRHRRQEGARADPRRRRVHPRVQRRRGARTGDCHPESGREKLREVLLSGGDPMVHTEQRSSPPGSRRCGRGRASSRSASARRRWPSSRIASTRPSSRCWTFPRGCTRTSASAS